MTLRIPVQKKTAENVPPLCMFSSAEQITFVSLL
jgi:hypothetical protein